MLRRPFCGMAVCFLLGILGAAYSGGRSPAPAVFLPAAAWVFALWAVRYLSGDVRRLRFRVSVCALMFVLGFGQYQGEQAKRACYLPGLVDGTALTVQGKVAGKQIKYDQYLYELTSCLIENQAGSHPNDRSVQEPVACNRILAYSDSDIASVGEILVLNGTVELWKTAVNEGNFDARSFYLARKVDFALKDVALVSAHGQASRWREMLFDLRLRLREVYENRMQPEASGVMATMVIGDKTLLDEETKRLYQTAGLSHIMAISGLHISVIGMTLYHFLRKRGLPFGVSGLCAGVLLYGYGTMVGMGVSVQRAVGMFVLLLLAQTLGRSYDSLNALGLMALVLLWNNPYLLWDAGFQFSFAAILGVVWLGGCVSFEDAEHGKKKQTLFVSLTVQLATLPLAAWHYFEAPLYALPVNLIVLPLMGVLLACGVAGGLFGLVCQPAGTAILFCGEKLLGFVRFVCACCAGLPGSMAILGRPALWQVACYYAGLAGVAVFLYRRKGVQGGEKLSGRSVRRFLAVAAALLGVLLFRPPEGFEIAFLDVGQGDGSYIRTAEGCHLFVDGGSSDVRQVGTYRILPFLKSRRVKRIDFWFVSHTDEDHISGLKEALEAGYEIRNLVFAEAMEREEAYETLAALAQKNGTGILFVEAGDTLRLGGARVDMLYPAADAGSGDKNADSLVFSYREDEFCGLFTGDTGIAQEKEILRRMQELAKEETDGGTVAVDVYKAAHHGSKYSNSELLLAEISPQAAVVSCSQGNRYGHPHEEALGRMEQTCGGIFCTMDLGQITVRMGEKGVKVYGFSSSGVLK